MRRSFLCNGFVKVNAYKHGLKDPVWVFFLQLGKLSCIGIGKARVFELRYIGILRCRRHGAEQGGCNAEKGQKYAKQFFHQYHLRSYLSCRELNPIC